MGTTKLFKFLNKKAINIIECIREKGNQFDIKINMLSFAIN